MAYTALAGDEGIPQPLMGGSSGGCQEESGTLEAMFGPLVSTIWAFCCWSWFAHPQAGSSNESVGAGLSGPLWGSFRRGCAIAPEASSAPSAKARSELFLSAILTRLRARQWVRKNGRDALIPMLSQRTLAHPRRLSH